MSEGSPLPPLVIFCLDAGDVEFIREWTQEGFLPNIGSLMKRGCWGKICGSELVSTQGAWLSFFSGISPVDHGYYYHRQLRPGSYDIQRVNVRQAQALPFWSSLGGKPQNVMAIDAPETYPIAGVPGLQLSNWAIQQQFNTAAVPVSAEPASLIDEVEHLIGPSSPIEVFHPSASFQEDVKTFHLLLKRIKQKGLLCRHFLMQKPYDLIVIGCVEAHTAAHRFWNYGLEGVPQPREIQDKPNLRRAIQNVYQALDHELGLILDCVPREANIFVVSLFGMKSQYPTTGLMDAFCRQLGYHVLLPDAAKILNPLALARRILPPHWRAEISLFLPLWLQERLQVEQFQAHTDWEKTTAFPLPGLNSSFLRINLRGREPQGIVEIGREYDSLLNQIELDLQQLVEIDTGEPVIEKVTRVARDLQNEPPVSLPDLFIEWKDSVFFRERVVHPKTELYQNRPYYSRSSYHTFNGFFSAAGPNIRARGDIGQVPLMNFAPTFLSLIGQDLPIKQGRGLNEWMITGNFFNHELQSHQ